MDKVLIIGGAGFIGYHLASKLSLKYEIHIIDNFSRGKKDKDLAKLLELNNVKALEIDILDENQIASLDNNYYFIFQLAAIVGVQNVVNKPYDTLYKNFLINHNSLKLALKQKSLKRFIFTSTSEVQSSSSNVIDMLYPTPENFPIIIPDLNMKRSTYMLSKIYGEAMCIHNEVPSLIFRPHNIYGPRMGMSHVIPELLYRIRNAKKNEILEINSFTHKRAFCFIDDAVALMQGALENINNKISNQILNVGNPDEESSIKDLISVLLNIVGRKDIEYVPAKDTLGSPSRRCPNIDKIKKISNYIPKVNLYDGCTKTWEWYKEVL